MATVDRRLPTTTGGDQALARLSRAVIALATPPPPRRPDGRAKGIPGRTENLVLEFDEAYTAWVEGFVELPEEARLLALQRLDGQLAAMVAAKDAALWTEEAHREADGWHDVRSLAARVSSLFGWSLAGVDAGSAEAGASS